MATHGFLLDHRALNIRMKADKFPTPKVEKVIENMVGANSFSKLDMFAGFGQIQ